MAMEKVLPTTLDHFNEKGRLSYSLSGINAIYTSKMGDTKVEVTTPIAEAPSMIYELYRECGTTNIVRKDLLESGNSTPS